MLQALDGFGGITQIIVGDGYCLLYAGRPLAAVLKKSQLFSRRVNRLAPDCTAVNFAAAATS